MTNKLKFDEDGITIEREKIYTQEDLELILKIQHDSVIHAFIAGMRYHEGQERPF